MNKIGDFIQVAGCRLQVAGDSMLEEYPEKVLLFTWGKNNGTFGVTLSRGLKRHDSGEPEVLVDLEVIR